MIKPRIGYITNTRIPAVEDETFQRIAKKVGVDLVIINPAKDFDSDKIAEKVKDCDIIYNNEIDYSSLEIAKQLEFQGHKVVESSRSYYYTEDKWILYLQCLKSKIPTPRTVLLSSDLISARDQIKNFSKFPIILKRVQGCMGKFVDRADDADSAIEIVKKFWERGEDRFPIIAQEFVDSDSYRVLTIGGKIVQTALKKSTDWKATGMASKTFEKFEVDAKLKRIIRKITKVIDIEICGIDLAKKENGDWILIEVNSGPAYDFFENEISFLIEKALRHLKKRAIELKNK